jgi:hypothetical protein
MEERWKYQVPDPGIGGGELEVPGQLHHLTFSLSLPPFVPARRCLPGNNGSGFIDMYYNFDGMGSKIFGRNKPPPGHPGDHVIDCKALI